MAFRYLLTLQPANQPVMRAAVALNVISLRLIYGWVTPQTYGMEYFHLG